MKWHNGYIKWFDNLSGTGVVKIPDLNKNVFLHWSADQRLSKLKDKSKKCRPKNLFIKYNSMDQIRCTILDDSHFTQIDKIKLHKWIKYEDLVSDILLAYFNENIPYPTNHNDFVLNNIIELTERKI